MSPTRNLARRAVHQLSTRLERLHEALLGLGQRLRDSIATLVSSHVGAAVREAVRALLEGALAQPPGNAPRPRQPYGGLYRDDVHRVPDRDDLRRGAWHDDELDDPLYRDELRDDPYRGGPFHERDDLSGPGPGAHGLARPATPEVGPLPGWWTLLPPLLHLVDWWLRRLAGRPRLLGALGVGLAAALSGVVAGPLAGAVTATTGAAVLLTSLADGVNDAVAELAGAVDR
jgi:hypothetical protein